MSKYPWTGKAKRINDYDLPRVGHKIGVGEDVIHMLLDVESRGVGFDNNGVIKLFEEHKFYRHVKPSLRDKAVGDGLAHPKWRSYYKNNHSRFLKAYELDSNAALMSTSWGLGQIMGENCKLVGYNTAEEMVKAFADSEAAQLEAMVNFIVTTKIDDELREMEKTPSSNRAELVRLARLFARVYNGSGYERNNYHNRLVDRLIWWRGKPDTPWSPDMAIEEDLQNSQIFQEEITNNAEQNAEIKQQQSNSFGGHETSQGKQQQSDSVRSDETSNTIEKTEGKQQQNHSVWTDDATHSVEKTESKQQQDHSVWSDETPNTIEKTSSKKSNEGQILGVEPYLLRLFVFILKWLGVK